MEFGSGLLLLFNKLKLNCTSTSLFANLCHQYKCHNYVNKTYVLVIMLPIIQIIIILTIITQIFMLLPAVNNYYYIFLLIIRPTISFIIIYFVKVNNKN